MTHVGPFGVYYAIRQLLSTFSVMSFWSGAKVLKSTDKVRGATAAIADMALPLELALHCTPLRPAPG